MGKSTYAVLCLLLVLSWQWLTVTLNYGGNWTALFCTGDTHPLPPQLASENIYTFAGSAGFDAQFYHYIAHDPVPGGDLFPYVQAARMRYQRILIPALAYAMAFGRHQLIDFTYFAACYLFLFLGVWWLGAYAERWHLHPAWGMAFLLMPASIVFVDRLTVDHALAALTVGFVLYAARQSSWELYAVLALAPFARETGLLLPVAYGIYCLCHRHWKRAAVFATAAAPWLVWVAFVSSRTPPTWYGTSLVPLKWLLRRLANPVDYPPEVPLAGVVQFGDVMALAGMLVAILLGLLYFINRPSTAIAIAGLLFALLTVFLQKEDVWLTAYNYCRIFCPLVVLVAAAWLPLQPRLALLPVILMAPRLLMQYGKQVMGIIDALLGV